MYKYIHYVYTIYRLCICSLYWTMKYTIYGIIMVYLWYIYGIFMVYLWYIYGMRSKYGTITVSVNVSRETLEN